MPAFDSGDCTEFLRCVSPAPVRCYLPLFVLDADQYESSLTPVSRKLMIPLFIFFCLKHLFFYLDKQKDKELTSGAKQSRTKCCSSCCNFLADVFLICIPDMKRLLMRFTEAFRCLATVPSLSFCDIFGLKIRTTA